MFQNAVAFNQDISKWDVSKVTDMRSMLQNARAFKGKLCSAAWVYSKAKKVHMFTGSPGEICHNAKLVFAPKSATDLRNVVSSCLAKSAVGKCTGNGHPPMPEWDVSEVTDTSGLFNHKQAFNQDISKWVVSKVKNMNNMFQSAFVFNQDISKWDVSEVRQMSYMFYSTRAFNQDISKWAVSKVTNMHAMFGTAAAFNQDISKWAVSKVTNMYAMFQGAVAFNQDISKWEVSKVTDMRSMFQSARAFKRKLCSAAWVNSKAKKVHMFSGSPGELCQNAKQAFAPKSATDLKNVVSSCLAKSAVGKCTGNGHPPMPEWDVSEVTDTSGLFNHKQAFNQDISKWVVSKVKYMNSMFQSAFVFNQDISKWDVSEVSRMVYMFYGARAFNQDISKWAVSEVTDMSYMFQSAVAFNQDISKWAVSKVRDMSHMFQSAAAFNQEISKWAVSKVTNMYAMFQNAVAFNQDISKWDVSKVTDMRSMLQNARAFKRKLCSAAWVYSKAKKVHIFTGSPGEICHNAKLVFAPKSATDLKNVVSSCLAKSAVGKCTGNGHPPMPEWDVSEVTDTSGLFNHKQAFNQDISKWVVSKVKYMNSMF